jgi:hypothetical protein
MLMGFAVDEMIRTGELITQQNNPRIYTLSDFGKPGDAARLKAFLDWHRMFLDLSQKEEVCGLVLERIVFEAVQKSEKFTVFGTGPVYDSNKILIKPKFSELIHYNGKMIYGGEHGAGLDLFMTHNELKFPIGLEAKNIREWVYPSAWQIWRLIARACSFECLPVLITRKIPFTTRSGLFKNFGILGFESQFQYFSPQVKALSKYRFDQNVVHKDRLGFADIKYFKDGDAVPKHFNQFFESNLYKNAPLYYDRFLSHLPILKKYAIDKGLAEESISGKKRRQLYQEFKEEVGFDDPADHDQPDDIN